MSELRVGLGVDAHAFADGVPLVLGGVAIDSPRGLAGHSDGDVIAHALIDALLGAAGLGDIGLLFPAGEPEWAGASSLDLLRRAGHAAASGQAPQRGTRARQTMAPRSISACAQAGSNASPVRSRTRETFVSTGSTSCPSAKQATASAV